MSYSRTLVGLKPTVEPADSAQTSGYSRTLVGLKPEDDDRAADQEAGYSRTLVGLKQVLQVPIVNDLVTAKP